MRKFKVEMNKKGATQSQDKIKEHSQEERDNSSIDQPLVFIFSNRWDVEAGRSVITSGSQSTSKVVVADYDLGRESFLNQIAASQTGLVRFQETRLLSSKELRRRAMKAFKKAEERRKQLLSLEEVETDL
jgi:hypothetical protein